MRIFSITHYVAAYVLSRLSRWSFCITCFDMFEVEVPPEQECPFNVVQVSTICVGLATNACDVTMSQNHLVDLTTVSYYSRLLEIWGTLPGLTLIFTSWAQFPVSTFSDLYGTMVKRAHGDRLRKRVLWHTDSSNLRLIVLAIVSSKIKPRNQRSSPRVLQN